MWALLYTPYFSLWVPKFFFFFLAYIAYQKFLLRQFLPLNQECLHYKKEMSKFKAYISGEKKCHLHWDYIMCVLACLYILPIVQIITHARTFLEYLVSTLSILHHSFIHRTRWHQKSSKYPSCSSLFKVWLFVIVSTKKTKKFRS